MVVRVRVEGEAAQRGSVDANDLDVEAGHEEDDPPSGVGPAYADVVEPAFVAQGDRPRLVDLVVAETDGGVERCR